jgi:Tfp pilus assembly PilM family ATPase
MRFPFLSSTARIGVDIQPEKIYLLQLKTNRSRYVIERMAAASLPMGVHIDGKVRQWDVLTDVLHEMVAKLGCEESPVTIGLPGHLVRLQHYALPIGMSHHERLALLRTQVARELPGMNDVLVVDYAIVGKPEEGYEQVVSVAAREEYVLQYARAVNAAGLMVKCIEIDLFAIQRVFARCVPSAILSGLYAFIYEVNHVVTLLVYQSTVLIYHQYWKMTDREIFFEVVNRQLSVASGLSTQKMFAAIIIGSSAYVLHESQLGIQQAAQFQLISLCMKKYFVGDQHYSATLNVELFPYLCAAGYAMQKVSR